MQNWFNKNWFSYHHTGTTAIVALGILVIATVIAWQYKMPSTYEPINLCDVNSDGRCDNQDLRRIDSLLGVCAGSNRYSDLADVDHNGCISLQDEEQLFSILVADWKTYQSDQYGFELKYPPNWQILNNSTGAELKGIDDKTIISLSFFDPSAIGISFCEAYPENRECEITKTSNSTMLLYRKHNEVYASIRNDVNHTVGITLTLNILSEENRWIFDQILSTFKFID